MNVAMSLRSRGAIGSAARTANVVARFGATAMPMARRLDRYLALAMSFGIAPTWPTTARVLERHPALLRRMVEGGAELAVHGLVHGDHAVLGRAAQEDSIARAIELFQRGGFAPTGFRGPYLRYNAATLDAIRALGLRYHSSQAVVFPAAPAGLPRTSDRYRRALALYGARDAARVVVRPRMLDGLVDIPIALPDDEILIERVGATDETAAPEWLHLLGLTHSRGELLTLQLHPERIDELSGALRAVLAAAVRRGPLVWKARLDEIADWWRRRSLFVLRVERLSRDRHAVFVDADRDATILVTRDGAHDIEARRTFAISGDRSPVVGIAPRAPASVMTFLSEEGFAVERSVERDAYGAYIDVASDWDEVAVLDSIERSRGPLVRIGRWPNGARSALAVTGDIDALTLQDFALRFWETRNSRPEV